jgi:WXG100 family type VII secretion target
MSNPGRLQAIADHLRQVAAKYNDAASTVEQQSQALDNAAQDLTYGTEKWAGKASRAFLNSWQQYRHDTQRSHTTLTRTAQSLNELAAGIDDAVNNLYAIEAALAGMGILDAGLTIASIFQLGLDPVTDTGVAGATGEEEQLIQRQQEAQQALEEVDAQVSNKLEEITSEIENSTELGNVDDGSDSGGSGDGGGGDGGNGDGNNNGDGTGSEEPPPEFENNVNNAIDKASSDPNKVHHIFDNPTHDHLWDRTGLDEEGNWNLIREALMKNYQRISGLSNGMRDEVVENFGNFTLVVRIIVLKGAIRIADAWIKP